MGADEPKSELSGQSIIYIAVAVLLFLFFIWSSLTAKRSKNYEDIPQAEPPRSESQK